MSLFALANVLATIVCLVWMGTSCVLRFAKPPAARHIWAELRPFYLPAAVFGFAYDLANGSTGWLNMFGDVCVVGNWWLNKDLDDDDDRWKRRKRKAADKVKALASGRLVPVPVNT